jgi:DNA-binding MarR family transcriptional regulator
MPEDRGETEASFDGLPPSAKLVAKVIEQEGSMDANEISDSARLHPSTTRDALKRLAEEGVVDVSVDSDEGRRLVYSIDVSSEA